jgi:hypothetical protein
MGPSQTPTPPHVALRLAGLGDFELHPVALHAVFREHDEQPVVDLDGPVDLLVQLFPSPQLLPRHPFMQPPRKLLVLARIADDGRAVVDWLEQSRLLV